MRRLVLASTLAFVSGCSESAGLQPHASNVNCTFRFNPEPVCSFKADQHAIEVKIITKNLADTEIALIQAKVVTNGKHDIVSISPDVSMNAGDIGIVSFADINFDNIPDIAISTSFGVANQYFDYWTYDPGSKKYTSVGNHPRLNPNPADKTLTANVKLNAATYQSQKYVWDRGKLIRQK